jgi:hypothetical protein
MGVSVWQMSAAQVDTLQDVIQAVKSEGVHVSAGTVADFEGLLRAVHAVRVSMLCCSTPACLVQYGSNTYLYGSCLVQCWLGHRFMSAELSMTRTRTQDRVSCHWLCPVQAGVEAVILACTELPMVVAAVEEVCVAEGRTAPRLQLIDPVSDECFPLIPLQYCLIPVDTPSILSVYP